MAIELAPLRIYHRNSIRNRLGSILDQTVQTIVFAHITEEVFLTPSGEQGSRQRGQRRLKVRGQNRRLMAAVPTLSNRFWVRGNLQRSDTRSDALSLDQECERP